MRIITKVLARGGGMSSCSIVICILGDMLGQPYSNHFDDSPVEGIIFAATRRGTVPLYGRRSIRLAARQLHKCSHA